jgi:uncharacterized protein YecE (DUF72 family)
MDLVRCQSPHSSATTKVSRNWCECRNRQHILRNASASTVMNWYERTPPDFIFGAKVPQVVTHERVSVNCEAEFNEFIDQMKLLREKLGLLLLQFPWSNKYQIEADEFFRRLPLFLKRPRGLSTVRLVVEIRNKAWLEKRFTELLRKYNVTSLDRPVQHAATAGSERWTRFGDG